MGLFGSSFSQPGSAGYLMNIGQAQQPQNPWEMAMQPTQQQAAQQFQQQYGQQYQTPGIGDGLPGVPKTSDMHVPYDPLVNRAAHPSFFGKGGMGSKIGVGILGGLADGLAQWGGAPPGYRNAMQAKQEYEQRQQELQDERKARMAERMAPHAEQVGNSIGMLDPATGAFTPTYTAPQQEQVPEVVRRITAAGIDPNSEEGRRLIVGSITNSPDAIAAQTALVDHRFGNSMTLKQTAPGRSGSASHPPKYAIGPNGQVMKWVP